MKVVLVTCFNANWALGRVPSPYIPLNLLSLGTGLRNNGHEVEILDQTLALLQGKANNGPNFYRQVAELIYVLQPDVVGLTTMCNAYPHTLSLAHHYREIAPHTKIILGGPQATVTDLETLRFFPWIDVVVRGEADYSLPELINCWEKSDSPGHLAGITWREKNGHIHRNDDAPLLNDMDKLPFPAYDLYPLDQVNSEAIPIEVGRGCPYGCVFCSTSRFFKRRYRIKSVEHLVAEMNILYEKFGFTEFKLVHDNLTVDRRWMKKFCRMLLEGNYSFKWGGGARVDAVDEELLAEMAKAGCKGIFFGIETGSQRLQPIIKKRLKLERVLPTIRSCTEHNITTTASFITGFPDETEADMLDSLNMALDISAMTSKANVQMHLLAPLTGSPLYEKHKGELQFDHHSSDISLFRLGDTEVDRVLCYPEVFPSFYYIPTHQLGRDLAKAASAAMYTYPTLLIVLRHIGMNLEDVLKEWVTWQQKHVDKNEIDQNYYSLRFGLDFCCYLRAEVSNSVKETIPFFDDMVNYLEVQFALQRGHICKQTTFYQFEYDVQSLKKKLRSDISWPLVSESAPTGLLFINLAFKPEQGFIYLEVKVPRDQVPMVRPGDELEIRDPLKQLQTRPYIIVRNNTQERVFATKHHMTPETLRAMGLPVTTQ